MINKEKLIKKLIDAYEDYIIEASINIPVDHILLNHPDGAEFGVVQTDLGAKLNNYKDVMKNGVNDMFDLMLDNEHPANKRS